MKVNTEVIREGYDGERCLVHARCCFAPDIAVATAQYLNINGMDAFDGIKTSFSYDKGETWTDFIPQEGLLPQHEGGFTMVGCDATPMYHKKTGKILLLGHTVIYEDGSLYPYFEGRRWTFYSVFDSETKTFSKMKVVDMPQGYEKCGNGSGQSLELENGDLLIPVYYERDGKLDSHSAVMRCTFDGKDVVFAEIGNSLSLEIERGASEPSVIYHNGSYYMTIRNDECGLVAKSDDGLNYYDMRLWRWEDGSILQNYNTQQHFMTVGDDLYLVYTRRGADNDRVFRHRAPLFAAKVEDMHLVKATEIALTPQRGARCGNFCATKYDNTKSAVMVSEWMQPRGCEAYGSNNAIFLSIVG